MHFSTLLALASAVAVDAATKGFNYGSTFTDGSFKQQSDFEADFKRAASLQGTSGFNSARLYTMIQGGTTNTPSQAIPAAIATKTTLLLGMWASGGQAGFNNELAALKSAISQYGSKFTDLVVGLSIGSEDLYRISPTGIENQSGIGAGPDDIVNFIKQTKTAMANTPAAKFSIGHVDTWTAWVNSSNNAVIENVDWLGVDSYPYFETTQSNGIENNANLFFESYNATVGAAQGKDVWVTETGYPVSGKTAGLAVPSVQNAEKYWQDVGCKILGSINTWWYTIQDAAPTTPNPSFGIVGSDLNSAPLYDLTCKSTGGSSGGSGTGGSSSGSSSQSSPASASATGSGSGGSGNHGPSGTATGSSGVATATGSSSGSGSSGASPSSSSGSGSSGSSPNSSSPASPSSTIQGSSGAAEFKPAFGLVAAIVGVVSFFYL